jgi:hypothetical protein
MSRLQPHSPLISFWILRVVCNEAPETEAAPGVWDFREEV